MTACVNFRTASVEAVSFWGKLCYKESIECTISERTRIMRKIKLLTLLSFFVFALMGCGAGKEEEVFDQGNIMPFYGPIMETENAYYYTTNDFKYELHYYDKASGKSIFLCNKPECSHDGNEFCAATAGGRFVMYTTMYKDGIYVAALEPQDGRVDKKLFKVSLDGTKIETIATFGYEPTEGGFGHSYDEDKYMVVYQGKAFIPYFTPQEDGFLNYGTAIVDIESGKVKYLEECDGHKLLGQERYIPYGEYLYYYETCMMKSPITLYRYHISKGTVEEIPIAGGFVDYCIVDGRVVYTQPDEEGFVHIYSMNPDNPDNPEIKDLTGPLTKKDGTSLMLGREGKLRYDGEYLVTYFYEKEKGFCYLIFSKEGTFLTEFVPPESINREIQQPDFAIMNGYVYFADYTFTVRCELQDLLNGNPTWTTLFYTAVEEAE